MHEHRYDERIEAAPGLVLDPLPGHNPGHFGVYVGDPPAAVVTGHLFLHPAQVANPDVADLDHDPGAEPSCPTAMVGGSNRRRDHH